MARSAATGRAARPNLVWPPPPTERERRRLEELAAIESDMVRRRIEIGRLQRIETKRGGA